MRKSKQAAEQTELPPHWRGALITGFQAEFTKFIGVATSGASDFYQALERRNDGD